MFAFYAIKAWAVRGFELSDSNPVNLNSFPDIPKRNRKMPKSLRRFIYRVVEKEFNLNCDVAAKKLASPPVRAGHLRGYHKTISADGIKKVILNKYRPSYTLLDAIARYYDVPLSIILLFSRICSEMDHDADQAKRARTNALNLISAYKAALTDIEKTLLASTPEASQKFADVPMEFFKQMINAYKHERDNQLKDFELE